MAKAHPGGSPKKNLEPYSHYKVHPKGVGGKSPHESET